MRHIRTRRRFKIILILLFVICLAVFIENRIQDLAPQFKSLAQARIEDAMGGKMSFSIGSIGGGVVHPIVLNDIRIKQKDGSQFVQSLVIDSIRTNYYIKDIVKAMGGARLPPLLNRHSTTYVNFSVKNGDIKGFVGLYGDLTDSRIDGYLIFRGSYRLNFSGNIKNDTFDLEVRPEGLGMGSVRAVGALSPDNVFVVDLKFDHLKAAGFDLVCDMVLRNRLVKSDDAADPGHIEGEFETTKTILNFKPFLDIKASYKLMRDSVKIENLALGDVMSAYGKVSLRRAGNVDLTFLINNMSINWLTMMFGKKEAVSPVTGTMNGKIELKGAANKFKLSSRIDIKGGTISSLDFDYLTLSLRGDLPFLKIEESRITRKSGYLELAGELDIRRIGKSDFFNNIKLNNDDTAISWDEWRSTQGKDGSQIEMKKNLGAQFGFGYKKFVRDDKIDESLKSSDEVQINYNLQPNDSLKVMVGQDKDFVGFEHKDKF